MGCGCNKRTTNVQSKTTTSTANINTRRSSSKIKTPVEAQNFLDFSEEKRHSIDERVDFTSKIEILKAVSDGVDVTQQVKENAENPYYLIFSFNRFFTENRSEISITFKHDNEIKTKTFPYESTVCVPEIKSHRLAIVLDGPYIKETLKTMPKNIWPIVLTHRDLGVSYFTYNPPFSNIESRIFAALLLARTLNNFDEVSILKDGCYPEDHFYFSGGVSVNKNVFGFSMKFQNYFSLSKNSFLESLRGDFKIVYGLFDSFVKRSLIQIPPIPELDRYDNLTDVPSKNPIIYFNENPTKDSQEFDFLKYWGRSKNFYSRLVEKNDTLV